MRGDRGAEASPTSTYKSINPLGTFLIEKTTVRPTTLYIKYRLVSHTADKQTKPEARCDNSEGPKQGLNCTLPLCYLEMYTKFSSQFGNRPRI